MPAAHTGGQREGAVEPHWKQWRLNFLSLCPSGLVLITPPQAGVFADASAARGKWTDYPHPRRRSIMNEYFTDGEDDLSADGINSFAADAYYRVVAADIRAMPAETPLTIGGGVAWVAAESAPGRFRLTLVDSAYIDPGDQTAVITLSTVTPLAVTDIPTDKRIRIEDARTARVPVACGVFRFLAVDMENAL